MKNKYEITIGMFLNDHTFADCEIHVVEGETIGEALGKAMRIPICPFGFMDKEPIKREIIRIQKVK